MRRGFMSPARLPPSACDTGTLGGFPCASLGLRPRRLRCAPSMGAILEVKVLP
jgi:hypothetical protein